jgi:hypothetical protein
MPRYLTKSRFILGNDCPTKLFYTGKREYTNSNHDDDFLKSLAEGGMVVGELAKRYYPEGQLVSPIGDDPVAVDETRKLLQKENVVIFEAAVTVDNLLCRIDILVKKGNKLEFIEVKAKSVDGNDDDPFRSRKGSVRSDWKDYLLDIAFQRFVLQQAYPEFQITSSLMLVNKSQSCTVDGLHQLFKVEKQGSRTTCHFVGDSATNPICTRVLKKYPVDDCIDEVCRDGFDGRDFATYVRWLASNYENDTKIRSEIGTHCKTCEFRGLQGKLDLGERDGFRECWKEALGWSDTDFERPTVFDLYNFSRTKDLIAKRRIALEDLSDADFDGSPDLGLGLDPSSMQRIRWSLQVNRANESYVATDGLREVMRNWRFPLHFIDFETAAPPIPLHYGRRPYESIAFQFSHHTLDEDGSIRHAGEYLNIEPGIFPNFDFLRNLMASLNGDNGTIFRYADHENTILNHIIDQLDNFGQEEPDYLELRNFACSITHPTKANREARNSGDRDMVDLRDVVARYYYHPRMRGSQSIKYVLPAVLTDSTFLRQKYSSPSYGYEVDHHSSRNFAKQTWIQFDGDTVKDPYKLLPNVSEEFEKESWDELWTDEDIRGGGAAMAAYLRLQQKGLPQTYRDAIAKGLLRYCELDTLAMVMIVEAWRNRVGLKP